MQIYHRELYIHVITPQLNVSAGTSAMCMRLRCERHTLSENSMQCALEVCGSPQFYRA